MVELGCGVALPGLLAARLGCDTTLTDVPPLVLHNARASAALNNIACRVVALKWGEFNEGLFDLATQDKPPDILLGSDCFYDSKAFDDLLFTISYFFDQNPACVFVTTYQERNVDRSLWHLTLKWGISLKEILAPDVDLETPAEGMLDPEAVGESSVHLLVLSRTAGA